MRDFRAQVIYGGPEDETAVRLNLRYTGEDGDVAVPREAVRAAGGRIPCVWLSVAEPGLTLRSITLPENVEEVRLSMAWWCEQTLSAIHVDGRNPWLKDVDGVLLSRDGRRLIRAPAAMEGTYAVPEGVEVLEGSAFRCSRLERILLPDTLREVRGYGVFQQCENLRSLVIPAGVAAWSMDHLDCGLRLEEFAFLGRVEVRYPWSPAELPGRMAAWLAGEEGFFGEAYLLACLQQGFPDLDGRREAFLAAARRGGRKKIAAWLAGA